MLSDQRQCIGSVMPLLTRHTRLAHSHVLTPVLLSQLRSASQVYIIELENMFCL